MSVKAILTEQQKSYTKAEEDALFANYYDKDYIDTYMAPLDTPTFIGVPKAPTAAAGTNTTQIATTAFVEQAKNTRMPVYGKGVNLLRNWYFVGGGTGRGVFPVNQRGQSSYSGAYSIDGWHGVTASQMTLTSGYITTASTTYWQDGSPEILKSLLGKSVTASALLADGTLVTGTAVYRTSYSGNNVYNYGTQGILKYGVTNSGAGYQCLRLEPGSYVAVKVELGTEQTLCHNEGTDANPVWVLNDVPDYEYELYRCMTSTADSGDTYANKSLATQQQLAPIEWGATASVQHGIGSCFCWNGLLYRTIVTIPANGPITPGTNCEIASIADAIDPLAFKILFAQATDIHTDTTVTLNDSGFKYKFLVLALSADSANSSSNRGSLTIPIATISGGMHYPVYVGITGGAIRVGLSGGEPNKLRFITTSLSSVYLQVVYGIR